MSGWKKRGALVVSSIIVYGGFHITVLASENYVIDVTIKGMKVLLYVFP